MPRPTPQALVQQNPEIEGLRSRELDTYGDRFPSPRVLVTEQEDDIRTRSTIRPDAAVETATITWRSGHRARSIFDTTGAPGIEDVESHAQANQAAFDANSDVDRPSATHPDSRASAVDASRSLTLGTKTFQKLSVDPKELLLRRNPFRESKNIDDSTEGSKTSDAHSGENDAISLYTSSRSSIDTHTLTSVSTSSLGYDPGGLTLTDEDVHRFEAAARAYQATRLHEKEGDLGVQLIPEEKVPVIPDFAFEYPPIEEPKDPARTLKRSDLESQRAFFFSIVIALNVSALIAAIFAGGTWVFVFILFIKAKDCLSSVGSAVGLLLRWIYRLFVPRAPVDSKWILTLLPAYSESEAQIVKTIFSLKNGNVEPHRQVMCVMLDGKHRAIKKHMTHIIASWRRPYVTSKFKMGELIIDAGFMENIPVLCIEKVKNSGKKDSLILCHDLFNVMRENAPLYTKLLRREIWTRLLPTLTEQVVFEKFDMVFCTDADSTIHKGAVASLANAVARNKNAIAACGLVLVELEEGFAWSRWNLYQQFQVTYPFGTERLATDDEQYTFGQYVRRRAEGLYGKVTCLPGCITMIAVRPEMAGAIRKYAEPITAYPVILHQVQYLGTDRRLTYSMLSQDRKLKTLFVPEAISETVAPQSLTHYLSQRRRWGSNAYFNNYFYCFGEKMTPIMRLAACIELVRLTMVYYRIANTVMFIYGLTRSFSFMKLVPLLVVSQTPTIWFMFCVFFVEKELRRRCHKLILGFLINKAFSPFIAVTVFTKVAKNLGSQVWGLTGGANATVAPAEPADPVVASMASNATSMSSNVSSVLTASNTGSGASSMLTTESMPGVSGTAIALNEGLSTVVMETFLEGGLGEQLANLPDAELAEEEANEKLAGAEEPMPPFG